MPWSKLNDAATAVAKAMNPPPPEPGGPSPLPGTPPRVNAAPTVDGRIITMRSFFDAAPGISKNIPILIGSVSEEGGRGSSHAKEADWLAALTKVWGDAKSTELIAAMKKAHPEKSLRTLSCGVAGLNRRNSVTRMATLKHDLKGAPVYSYFFTWQSPMLEDAGAWHTAELAFCFDNTKRCRQATGDTPKAQALAKKMATAWANFARTGNPNQHGLTWTPFEPVKCPTMIFDNQCRMADDPEGNTRKILLG
jgi:para-nitrobenzyl esterase